MRCERPYKIKTLTDNLVKCQGDTFSKQFEYTHNLRYTSANNSELLEYVSLTALMQWLYHFNSVNGLHKYAA